MGRRNEEFLERRKPRAGDATRPRRVLRRRLGMGSVDMGGVDAARRSAPEPAKCDPNRTMADGDLSRTHLQVAREGRCRRSHVKLERWPEPAPAPERDAGEPRVEQRAPPVTCFPAPFFPLSLGFNRSWASLLLPRPQSCAVARDSVSLRPRSRPPPPSVALSQLNTLQY